MTCKLTYLLRLSCSRAVEHIGQQLVASMIGLKPASDLQTKLKPEDSSIIVLSRVLQTEVLLQMSTQSYIRLRHLTPVADAVKLVISG